MEIDYSNAGIWALMVATFILATTHTVSPDHWFPFVMVGRANRWKLSWVLGLAIIAGIGHVGTSVAIGLIGVFAKKGAAKEVAIFLENITPILLMVFGFGYAAYAFYKQRVGAHGHSHGIPIINKWLRINPHTYDLPSGHHVHKGEDYHRNNSSRDTHKEHSHTHNIHSHSHQDHAQNDHNHGHTYNHHNHEHAHDHHHHGKSKTTLKDKRAGWGLVAILGLTPCIALLPLTFAAVKYGNMAIVLVNVCFTVATISTIVLFAWLGLMGLSWIKLEFFDEYGDIIAGVIIGLLGVATKVFGL
jgi:ABC-type nickel/cobalt efflux system permease component RcnA